MKLLIWDFDGTLGHREACPKTAWSTTAKEILADHHPEVSYSGGLLSSGFPWHNWEVPHVGQDPEEYWKPIATLYQQMFETLGLHATAVQLSAQVRERFCDYRKWHLYPGTLETLEAVSKKGYQQVVLSNHVPELNQIIEHLGVGRHLNGIFNSGLTGYEKPHPESYLQILRAYPQAKRVVMVGDNRTADVLVPEQHGIEGILLRSTDPELKSAQSHEEMFGFL
ncbi:HAD family hydrolase [Deinococcus misasensis]|uniref:HAD family hydrolase n=1 Tax=Deinococcus misasensis TaxID=392413 RepID=UPI00069104F5|nr:HAD family hydrolase [Deinococcus misasensis]